MHHWINMGSKVNSDSEAVGRNVSSPIPEDRPVINQIHGNFEHQIEGSGGGRRYSYTNKSTVTEDPDLTSAGLAAYRKHNRQKFPTFLKVERINVLDQNLEDDEKFVDTFFTGADDLDENGNPIIISEGIKSSENYHIYDVKPRP